MEHLRPPGPRQGHPCGSQHREPHLRRIVVFERGEGLRRRLVSKEAKRDLGVEGQGKELDKVVRRRVELRRAPIGIELGGAKEPLIAYLKEAFLDRAIVGAGVEGPHLKLGLGRDILPRDRACPRRPEGRDRDRGTGTESAGEGNHEIDR